MQTPLSQTPAGEALARPISQLGQIDANLFLPHEQLPAMFHGIASQRAPENTDGKALVDAVPVHDIPVIMDRYDRVAGRPDFDPARFFRSNFRAPLYETLRIEETTETSRTLNELRDHVRDTWPKFIYEPRPDHGTFIGTRYPHLKPGTRGRFGQEGHEEGYYWDSVYGVEGIIDAAKTTHDPELWKASLGVALNFADMVDRFGHIPNGTRSYYVGRSQPPKFADLVELLADNAEELVAHIPGLSEQYAERDAIIEHFLPQLVKEYQWWMKGEQYVTPKNPAVDHVVLMPDGSILNRFHGAQRPRPESRQEDLATAERAHRLYGTDHEDVFGHLNDVAESGRDMGGAKWFRIPTDIATIETGNRVPVELNSMLGKYERMIAEAHVRAGRSRLAAEYFARLEARDHSINTYQFNPNDGAYHDRDWVRGELTPHVTPTTAYPSVYGFAPPERMQSVAAVLARDFMWPGGVPSSLVETGEQWDQNGWGIEQKIAIEALRLGGHNRQAGIMAWRWINTNARVFRLAGELVEKCDVSGSENPIGGGGEYPVQIGFLLNNFSIEWCFQQVAKAPQAA